MRHLAWNVRIDAKQLANYMTPEQRLKLHLP